MKKLNLLLALLAVSAVAIASESKEQEISQVNEGTSVNISNVETLTNSNVSEGQTNPETSGSSETNDSQKEDNNSQAPENTDAPQGQTNTEIPVKTWFKTLGLDWVGGKVQSGAYYVVDSFQWADDQFNGLFVYAKANDKGEYTYAAQVQNALVYTAKFPFEHPVTTAVAALAIYAAVAACDQCDNDAVCKKSNARN